MYKVLKRRKI